MLFAAAKEKCFLDNDKLSQLMNTIIADYFTTFSYEPISLSLTFADDMWKAYFDLRSDHRAQLPNQLPAFNGTVVAPSTLDGTFTVIIDKQYFIDDVNAGRASWIGTIVHETTHARDYQEYAKLVEASNYDEVLDTNKHRIFQLWTEFNAKRHGYYFVRKYTFDNLNDIKQVPDIINIELPGQIAHMTEQYSSTTDGWKQIYTVSQFLGRLAVWEDLFPEQFNPSFVEALLSTNRWMFGMYTYLNTHRELSAAINSFGDLREIVRSNFQGA
jgi:hypothetical protein